MKSILKFLRHLLVPHESNNQKAKLLHPSSLSLIIFFLIGFQFVLSVFPRTFPSVLGYAANISAAEVIRLTNDQRAIAGLSPLNENKTLDSAALAKGQDMLAKGYWAHFAPDGTSPWSFFLKFGYKYRYAGENLGRDFSSAQGVVSAWMNSATHKENILNPRYKEIGIGIVEGSMSGTDTTIVVQFFGSSLTGVPSIPVARAATTESADPSATPAVLNTETPVPTIAASPVPVIAEVTPVATARAIKTSTSQKISPFNSTKNLSLAITALILLVLSIDLLIVKKRRIARIGGKTLAHLAYLSMILAVILILKAGQII